MQCYNKGAPPDGALDSEFPSAPPIPLRSVRGMGGVGYEDYYPRLCDRSRRRRDDRWALSFWPVCNRIGPQIISGAFTFAIVIGGDSFAIDDEVARVPVCHATS